MKKLSFLILICILLTACDYSVVPPEYPPLGYSDRVIEVNFTDSTKNITLRNLNRNNVFLVKVNTSGSKIEAEKTGGAYAPQHLANRLPELNTYTESLIIGHPDATRFQASPQVVPNNNILTRSPTALASSNSIGDKYNFWVETVYENGNFIQKEAILQAIGEHCKVWVIPNTDNEKTITQTKAETLAQKFDLIYPVATNLLGYEFGGESGGNGGRDGDPKIHILVYDIGKDYGGYFHPKDYYKQEQLIGPENSKLKTNNAEIFYIGAEQINENPDYAYSTLIHEFQHMINWNIKTIQKDLESDPWYNEMLSMMAEDVISSLVGISTSSNGHVQRRIPGFLAYYALTGITNWIRDHKDHNEENNNYIPLLYAYKYAYGAYLLRNYGGAALLNEIISNNYIDETSITAALNKAYGSDVNFQYTLKRFGEALVFNKPFPEGVMSFDKTVSNNINGIIYTAYGFNIWNIANPYPYVDYHLLNLFNWCGPYVISLEYIYDIPKYSIGLFSHDTWLNLSGNIVITLQKPEDPNIKFILMVK